MKTDSSTATNKRSQASSRPSRSRQGGRGREASSRAILVALDSDGTVFDSMSAKHDLCFGPVFARWFGPAKHLEILEGIWRFVNLGSRQRGINRFKGLSACLHLALRHPQTARAMKREEPVVAALDAWLAVEGSPSRGRLETALASRKVDPMLEKVLIWSIAVDESIAGLPPPAAFAGARAALPLLGEAELIVLTAGPSGAIARDWQEAGILHHVASIAGQERGPKGPSLLAAMEGRYAPERVLVVGDAPGDLEAARSAGAFFYPIVPGREEESWASFASGYLGAFMAGSAPAAPIAAFFDAMPLSPPWLR